MNEIITDENLKLQIRCVSHEIRNHLSICDMYSQIIRKNLEKSNIENPSIENALDCIQKSIQIIGTNLLDLKSLNSTTERIYDFKSIIEKGVELSKAYTNEEKNLCAEEIGKIMCFLRKKETRKAVKKYATKTQFIYYILARRFSFSANYLYRIIRGS